MDYDQLRKRRKHVNVPTKLLMRLVESLWTRKLPRVVLSEEIPDGAKITMIQKRQGSDEYAVNIVSESWPELVDGQVSKEIKISLAPPRPRE